MYKDQSDILIDRAYKLRGPKLAKDTDLEHALTTEGYLGLALVMVGLLISIVSAMKMLGLTWRSENPDKEYSQAVVGPFFIYLSVATTPILLGFLTSLIAIFAPGFSNNTPVTFGFDTGAASAMFYMTAILAISCGAFGALRRFKASTGSEIGRDEKMTSVFSALYLGAGAVFALLAILLVLAGGGAKINADYVMAGNLYILGSALALVANWRFSRWFKAQILSADIDKDALQKGVMRRAILSCALFGIPSVAGIVLVAV